MKYLNKFSRCLGIKAASVSNESEISCLNEGGVANMSLCKIEILSCMLAIAAMVANKVMQLQNIMSECNVQFEFLNNWKHKYFFPVILLAFTTMLVFANQANAQLEVAWSDGHNGELTFHTDLISSPDKNGNFKITWNQPGPEDIQLGARETDPSGAETAARCISPNSVWVICGVPEDRAKLKYGDWHTPTYSCNSTQCRSVSFKPNISNINKLDPGQTVTTEFWAIHKHKNTATIYSSQKLTVTIRRESPVVANWSNGISTDVEGQAVLQIDTGRTYGDVKSALTVVKPTGSYFTFNGSSEYLNDGAKRDGDYHRNGALPASIQNLPSGYDRSRTFAYGSGEVNPRNPNTAENNPKKFRYGFWLFDEKNQLLTFRPDNSGLATLAPGDVAVSVLALNIRHANRNVFTKYFVVTIRKTGIKLTWENGITWTDGEVGKLNEAGSNSFTSLLGKSVINKPASGTISISASDNNDSSMSLTSTASTETGFSKEFESDYGKWYWKADNSGFRFDPDWDAINPLGDNSNAMTTLTVKVSAGNQEVLNASITLKLDGKGIVMEKVVADSTNNTLKLQIPNFASSTSDYCVALQIFTGGDLVASVHSPATVGGTVPVIKTLDTYEVRTSGSAPTITITSVPNANGNIEVALVNSDTDCGGETVTAASNQTVSHQFVGPAKVSINSLTMAEGDGAGGTLFQFAVSLTPATALSQTFAVPVTFSHVTTNSTDFVGGTDPVIPDVSFGTTHISRPIDIMVGKDTTGEKDESFTLTISEPIGAAKNMNLVTLDTSPGANMGVGTITDDDRALVSIDDLSLAEGDGTGSTQFQFTVSLTPATALNQTFVVPVDFKHLTTDSTDFVGSTDPVILDVDFGTTHTSRTVNVMVNKDATGEEDESFTLTIAEPTGIAKDMNLVTLDNSPGANVGTGTITDDDLGQMIDFNWDSGFDGIVNYDGISVHPTYVLGSLADSATNLDVLDNAVERKGNDILATAEPSVYEDFVNDSNYSGYWGVLASEWRIGTDLNYGIWYVKSGSQCPQGLCADILYIPDPESIRSLTSEGVITSTYSYMLVDSNEETVDNRPISVTINFDTSNLAVGFELENRNVEVAEAETASLSVSMNSAMNVPITIPFTITPGTALMDSDYRHPASLSVTIPAGETSGTISIPTIHDLDYETAEEFTVTLNDGTGYSISPSAGVATVKIVDDDSPSIRTSGGNACHEVPKPPSVATPNSEAYWKTTPATLSEPRVYYSAGERFVATVGFRTPVKVATRVYFGSFFIGGMPENTGLFVSPAVNSTEEDYNIGTPGNHRGHFRYKILPRGTTGNDWYHVGNPCEFHVWWTDANRPGITMSVDQNVNEGRSFRVTATATPKPNRDILVPVTLSDSSRITGPKYFNIRIKSGQESGFVDVPTNFLPGDQEVDDVTATAEWRSSYWLDDSKKSATVTIQDHDKKIIAFKNPNPDISVNEAGNAELVVDFDGTNTAGVTVKYRIDNVTADAMDYRAPANTEITIATGTEGTISIPINPNMDFEDTKIFTVTLVESDDALPADNNIVATVSIISDDPPPVPTDPGGERCDDVTQPVTTTTINTQAYWKEPFPYVYQESNSEFTAQMGFRDPVTKQTANINMATLFKIGIYRLDGSVVDNSDALGRTPTGLVDHIEFTLESPADTGFLNYRIDGSNEDNNEWYDIGMPCEFPIWWTDAKKPGIALSVDKKFLVEGTSFRVTATATPIPNLDILVPIILSDTTRIQGSQNPTIMIPSGQSSGHTDILTKFLPGDQVVDELTVSAEWRSTYWMDESVHSQQITISEETVPVLSIKADNAVTEADEFEATFTITSDVDPGEDIRVQYTPTETGNFFVAPVPDLDSRTNNGHISGQMTHATLSFSDQSAAGDGSGPFEATISIPLHGNANPDSEVRSVTVVLNQDTEGIDYSVATSDSSASIQIIDDETLPVLTFEAGNNPTEFDEPASAGDLTFKVTAAAMPLDAYPATAGVVEIDVHFDLSQTGNFIRTSNGKLTPDSPVKLIFTNSSGTVTADLAVPIAADEIEEPSGSVSVTLLAANTPAYYYKLGTVPAKSTRTVKIFDDDEPELSISITESQFVEGSAPHIHFTVTSRFTVDTPLMVNFSGEEFGLSDPDTPFPAEQNGFLGTNSSPATLDFSSSTTQYLNILITDDNDREPSNRHVKVTLLTGANYSVAGTDAGDNASILVIDDDAGPPLSVSGPVSVVESDMVVQFVVSTLDDIGTITVNFTLSDDESEDYLTDAEAMRSSASVTLEDADQDGTYTGVITVNLHDDGDSDRTGEIDLELTANAETYSLGTHSVATVKVYDDDAPELTISGGGQVTEVDPPDTVSARFTVESQALPNKGETDQGQLTVHYSRVSTNFLDSNVTGTNTSAVLNFTDADGSGNGPFRADLMVPIQSDTDEEADGTIEVTLEDEAVPGTSYYVVDSATGNHTASVNVIDNDSLLELTISGPVDDNGNPKGTAENEGTAVFVVTASRNPTTDITIAFDPVNVGQADFIAESYSMDFPSQSSMHPTHTLSFRDNGSDTYIADLPVLLESDNIKERTGEIAVTLIEDPAVVDRYNLGSIVRANATVWDDDAPELTIAGMGTVWEQQDRFASFQVTARVRPSSGSLRVSFTAEDSSQANAGQFIDREKLANPQELTFAPGLNTAILTVPIANDEELEEDGSITVTLTEAELPISDTTYTVSAVVSEKSATVVVKDDDSLPFLSISGPDSIAEYADMLTFTVTATADTKPESSFRVFYSLSQSGSFLHTDHTATLEDSSAFAELEFTGTAPAFTAELNFQLVDDEIGEDDGFVKVSIKADAEGEVNYLLSESNEHSVTVYDDDSPTIWITVLAENRVAIGGQEARFKVKSAVMPSTSRPLVRYRISNTDFVADAGKADRTATLTFVEMNGEYTAPLNIPLLNATTSTMHESLIATLVQSNSGTYTVATNDPMRPNSATILVSVDGATPTVAITPAAGSVVEGQHVRYTLQMVPSQNVPVPAMLKWSQDGDFIFSVYPRSISIPADLPIEVTVSTVDDNVPEEDGSLTLTVATTQNYQTIGEGTVAIKDNDDSVSAAQNVYSVAAIVIESILSEIPETDSQAQHQETKLQATIAPVEISILEGETAIFAIATDKFAVHGITVQIGLQQKGDFVKGPMSRSVKIPEGESEVLLSVETDNNEVAEEDGRISATIQDGIGYVIGNQKTANVIVSDAVDRMLRKNQVAGALQSALPELLANSTTRSLRITRERMQLAFHGHSTTSIELKGHSTVRSLLQTGGEMLNYGETDWQSLIDGSSFTIALHPGGEESSPATVWGLGEQQNLKSNQASVQLSWKGESLTGHFGFDATVGQGMLAGLAMSVARSQVGFNSDGSSGMSFDSHTTGVHPYFGFTSRNGNSQLQIMTGYGVDELELKQEPYSPEILSGQFHTVGFSGSNRVYSNRFGEYHNLELNAAGEAWHSKQFVTEMEGVADSLEVSVRHARLAIESTYEHNFSSGATLSPFISIGAREDGRNDSSRLGLDLSGKVSYRTFNGLEVSGSGKSTLSGFNQVNKWQIESSLDYDTDSDGKGILFSMSPAWSGTETNSDRFIWGNELVNFSDEATISNDGGSISTDIGYGFAVLDDSAVITPYTAFQQAQTYGTEFQVGSRIAIDKGLNFELEIIRDVPATGTLGHEVNLTGNIHW